MTTTTTTTMMMIIIIIVIIIIIIGGPYNRATDLRFTGSGFESWTSYLHICDSVTELYNLVPANGMISLALKVTAGQVESNDSLRPAGL